MGGLEVDEDWVDMTVAVGDIYKTGTGDFCIVVAVLLDESFYGHLITKGGVELMDKKAESISTYSTLYLYTPTGTIKKYPKDDNGIKDWTNYKKVPAKVEPVKELWVLE